MPYRDVIAALERAGCDPQGSGGQHKARCPVHRGDDRSLSVDLRDDKTLLRCWARGCDFKSISAALRLPESMFFETERLQGGRYPASQQKKGESVSKKPGFDEPTLEQIAAKSGVTADHLRSLGWTEGVGECEKKDGSTYTVKGCRVPYYRRASEGEEGSIELEGVDWPVIELFAKIRASLEGSPKYVHERPGTPGLYGEWLLDEYRARPKPSLIFGEGETDTGAATSQGLPFVGVPGVDLVAGVVEAEHLEGFDRLFLIREPGESGLKFCQNFAKHLPAIGWIGPVKVIELPEKDPAAMLKARGPEGFLPSFREATKAGASLNKVCPAKTGLIKWGTDLVMTPVRFVMYPLFPMGELTLLAGEAGIGKSTGVAAIAAAITRGEVLANCDPELSELGGRRVLVFSAIGEDRPEETFGPRFLACGGDMSRLAIYDTEEKPITFEDIDLISRVMEETKPAMVFFDTLPGFWPAGVKTSNQEVVVPLLRNICTVAKRHEASVVPVVWAPKSADSAMDMFFGSNAMRGLMRSGVTVNAAPDDDPLNGTRVGYYSHAKCNVAARAKKGLVFRISPEMAKIDQIVLDSLTADALEAVRRVGSFEWTGLISQSAEQAFAAGKAIKPRGSAGTLSRAVQVIGELFKGREGVEIPVGEVIEAVNRAKCMDHYWAARMELQLQERKGPGGQLLFKPSDDQNQGQQEQMW